MNRIAERLAEIINVPVDKVINDIDSGMWEILIELNRKNYFTFACCEGHLRGDNSWSAYIGFKNPYKFKEYPKNYDSAKHRETFYWSGIGEESRLKFLSDLYEWALSLPNRELKEIKSYTLLGKNKKRPNGKWRVLRISNDYEDIRIELNRKQTSKYELQLDEKIVGRI